MQETHTRTDQENCTYINSIVGAGSHGECARCKKLDKNNLLGYTEICEQCNLDVYGPAINGIIG